MLKVLPAVVGVLRPDGGAQLVVLVKPQFEAGRAQVSSGGVVRDPQVIQLCVVHEVLLEANSCMSVLFCFCLRTGFAIAVALPAMLGT